MSNTITVSASMRTRRTVSSNNFYDSAASQEFYDESQNFVGIVCLEGLNLKDKVITGIQFTITSANAGYGTGHTKTVYVRKSNYQQASKSGITGANYYGDALGTFTGVFYNNTTSITLSGNLLTALGTYFAQGNNTFTIFNPNPVKSSQGYSNNFLKWTGLTATITYEEGISVPTTSSDEVTMGTAVTINTNRQSGSATHTLAYSFAGQTGTIATNVGDSVSWTPPVSLSSGLTSATSGVCTITCTTFVNGVQSGSDTCQITLFVPTNVLPTISSIVVSEGVSGIYSQFNCFVRTKSKASVSISADGIYGSTISSYRTSVNGVVYTGSSFVSDFLNVAGTVTISVTITDSRGRVATGTTNITVVDYTAPAISAFTVERCTSSGTSKVDGTYIKINVTGAISSVNNRNSKSATVYYKLPSSQSWSTAQSVTLSSYSIAISNLVLSRTFDALYSYDLKIRVSDYFGHVEQQTSVNTKNVVMDFYHNGNGAAFGKICEHEGYLESLFPLMLSTPLALSSGGTGASNAADALTNLSAVNKTGDVMTGSLGVKGEVDLIPASGNTGKTGKVKSDANGMMGLGASSDGTSANERWLYVNDPVRKTDLDDALSFKTSSNEYRVFHSGMESAIPIANGGTGGKTAYDAWMALGYHAGDTRQCDLMTVGFITGASRYIYTQVSLGRAISATTVSFSGSCGFRGVLGYVNGSSWFPINTTDSAFTYTVTISDAESGTISIVIYKTTSQLTNVTNNTPVAGAVTGTFTFS